MLFVETRINIKPLEGTPLLRIYVSAIINKVRERKLMIQEAVRLSEYAVEVLSVKISSKNTKLKVHRTDILVLLMAENFKWRRLK